MGKTREHMDKEVELKHNKSECLADERRVSIGEVIKLKEKVNLTENSWEKSKNRLRKTPEITNKLIKNNNNNIRN